MGMSARADRPDKRVKMSLMALALLGGIAGVAPVKAASQQVSSPNFPSYPVKVSSNGRYLVDQNNSPFLIAGDNPHALVTMVSLADAAHYFDDREAHGFNTLWIDVLVAAYPPYSPENGATYDGILPFTGYIPGGADTAITILLSLTRHTLLVSTRCSRWRQIITCWFSWIPSRPGSGSRLGQQWPVER